MQPTEAADQMNICAQFFRKQLIQNQSAVAIIIRKLYEAETTSALSTKYKISFITNQAYERLKLSINGNYPEQPSMYIHTKLLSDIHKGRVTKIRTTF